jgi:type I restriction enzyme S subunit
LPTKLKYLFKERRGNSLGIFPPGAISFGDVIEKEMLNEDTLASYQDVFEGDFLVNPINLNYDLKSLRVARSKISVRVSPAYIVLESVCDADPSYLRWLMYQFDVAHMKTLGAGVRQTITFGDMGSCVAHLPPKSQQARIANFLDEQTARIDRLIAEKERLREVLEEWRASEIARVCFGLDLEQTLTGNQWIPSLPENWTPVRLKHLIAGIEQGWSPECEARLAEDDEWGVLKAGAANGGTYRESEHKALPGTLQPIPELEVRAGDVLVTRASGTADYVGSFAFVRSTRPRLMLSDKNFRLKFTAHMKLLPELLAWICGTHNLRQQVLQYVSGADGLAKNIGSGSLREIWLPVPPLELQASILTELNAIGGQADSLRRHLTGHIDRLREYRSSLISAAVTGELDVDTFVA